MDSVEGDDINMEISLEPGCSLFLYQSIFFRPLYSSLYGYPYGKFSCDLTFDKATPERTISVNTEMIAFRGGPPPEGFHE